ncbi:hypothetical protein IWX47DRAFT_506689 [Phyllosticta citricarpa]
MHVVLVWVVALAHVPTKLPPAQVHLKLTSAWVAQAHYLPLLSVPPVPPTHAHSLSATAPISPTHNPYFKPPLRNPTPTQSLRSAYLALPLDRPDSTLCAALHCTALRPPPSLASFHPFV